MKDYGIILSPMTLNALKILFDVDQLRANLDSVEEITDLLVDCVASEEVTPEKFISHIIFLRNVRSVFCEMLSASEHPDESLLDGV